MQATFFALFINSNPSFIQVGWEPGLFTTLVMVLTQVAGIAFTMWLGERMTEVGVGNGISLIITSGIIAAYPREIAATAQLLRTEAVQLTSLLAFIAVIVATIAGIVYVYQAERRVPVTYARARAARPDRRVGRDRPPGCPSRSTRRA